MQSPSKTIVAVCLRHYLPGFKSGGPVRTIANLVDHLGDELDFRVITSDRDAHDDRAYVDVAIDSWQAVGKSQVFYTSPAKQTLRGITSILNSLSADVVYLNSFFDRRFTILPLVARRLGILRQRKVILAPRGEFAASALRIKLWRKKSYQAIARLAGLYSGVTWHASSEFEREDIHRVMGGAVAGMARVAANLPKRQDAVAAGAWKLRHPGEPLRVVFLARIAPMKNLGYALTILATAGVACVLHIYGMVDDERYWRQCRDHIDRMPEHVRVIIHGPVKPDDVGRILAMHDVLLLPTLGENYGHVIAESLTQGTPVLISDRTPWRDLQAQGVGWDLSLDRCEGFVAAMRSLADMEHTSYAAMRRRAATYGLRHSTDVNAKDANLALFELTVRGDGSRDPNRVVPT